MCARMAGRIVHVVSMLCMHADFPQDAPDPFNNDKPRYIDGASHQILTFLLGSMYRLPTYPATIQVQTCTADGASTSVCVLDIGTSLTFFPLSYLFFDII